MATQRSLAQGSLAFLISVLALFAPGAQAAQVVLFGKLDAAQVVDVVSTSTATGFATVTIDTVLQTITTDLSWTGLTGPADRSHQHDAPAGASRLEPPNNRFFDELITMDEGHRTTDCGGTPGWAVIEPCVPASGSLRHVYQLTASDFDPDPTLAFTSFEDLLGAFMRDGLYIDMHTEAYAKGEIRGQLLFVAEPPVLALLLGGLALAGLGRAHGRRHRDR